MPSSSQLWLPGTVLVIGACSAHYHCHHHHNYHNDHNYHKYQNYLNYHKNHIFCAKKVVIWKVLDFCASAAFIITIKDLQILPVICTNKKSRYPLPWPWDVLENFAEYRWAVEQLSTLPLLRKLSLAKKLQNTGYILKGPRRPINQTNTK